jgi:hypothetical protein
VKLFFVLTFFPIAGVGHSLWMAELFARDSKPSLKLAEADWRAQKSKRRWRLWVLAGAVSFTSWARILYEYYWEYHNLNPLRRPLRWGDTPGTRLSLNVMTWAALEYMPLYVLQYESYWEASKQNVLIIAHVGAWISRRLYLRDYFSDEDLKKNYGIVIDPTNPAPKSDKRDGVVPIPGGGGLARSAGSTSSSSSSSNNKGKDKEKEKGRTTEVTGPTRGLIPLNRPGGALTTSTGSLPSQ